MVEGADSGEIRVQEAWDSRVQEWDNKAEDLAEIIAQVWGNLALAEVDLAEIRAQVWGNLVSVAAPQVEWDSLPSEEVIITWDNREV